MPQDLALDVLNDTMYWTGSFEDVIYKANLDGSNQTVAVTTPTMDFPFAIALDVPIPEPAATAVLAVAFAGGLRRRR